MSVSAPQQEGWVVAHGAGYGTSGPDQATAQLQTRLRELGFNVATDGQFGLHTLNAVRTFQQRHGITPGRGVDSATLELLKSPPDHVMSQVRTARQALNKAAAIVRSVTPGAKAVPAEHPPPPRPGSLRGSGAASRAPMRGRPPVKGGRRIVRTVQAAVEEAQQAQPKPKQRGGTGTAGSSFEQLHPRGRGGVWVSKGGGPVQSGAAVQAAQAQIGAKIDGQFGSATEQAVRRYQQQNGLQVDGVVGAQTLAAMQGKKNAAKVKTGQMTAQQEAWLLKQGTKKAKTTSTKKVKASAEQPTRTPDLEETTLVFGYGGDYSRSIKDGRDREPDYDRPIWDRSGVRIVRSAEIPDGRSSLQVALMEAVKARKEAPDGFAWARARAREIYLRERLQEAGATLLARRASTIAPSVRGAGGEVRPLQFKEEEPSRLGKIWSEAKHPRGRGGKWVDVMGKIRSSGKPGGELHRVFRPDHRVQYQDAQTGAMKESPATATRKDAESMADRIGNQGHQVQGIVREDRPIPPGANPATYRPHRSAKVRNQRLRRYA